MEELLSRCPRWALPARGQPALCAVSGGLDSMCLLDLLDRWCREREAKVVAAHFNHQLRGAESDRDEAFVRDWCEAHDIPFVSGSGDVRGLAEREGLSLEEAARTLRYEFLRREAEKLGSYAKIYTAHHADDNAETILFNLIRGTGAAGLAGMAYQQDGICRPLLDVTRAELAAYAAAHGIPHVEDSTNADPDAAARNFLRLEVLPRLKQINPKAVEHINGAGRRLREMESGMEDLTERFLRRASVQPGRVTIRLGDLAEAPEFLRHRVLLGMFDLLGVGRKDVGAVHLEALNRLWAHHGNDARISLPHGVTARLAASRLMLETLPPPNRLLKRVRDFAQVKYDGRITKKVANYALDLLDVDKYGLDHIDRGILLTMIEKFQGGPVGLDTLAAAISEDAGTLEDVYEPYLLKNGFIQRTPRGRVVTELAYTHLGIPSPAGMGEQ